MNIHASGTLCIVGKCLKAYLFILFYLLFYFEMTDNALEFHFSAIHLLISVYVLD